jgi:predicted Zn-dependent peptidase
VIQDGGRWAGRFLTSEDALFPQNESISSTRLPSGVQVISETMPGVASVSIGVWADAGSEDEGPAEFGAAHFLEHMLFKGTETRNAFALAEAIEDVGGQLNAFTERETTHLYCRILAEHLPIGIELLADMACHSTLPDDELQRERQVIIEEIHKYEALPEERIQDLMMTGLWHDGMLGHPILGTEESVAALTRADLFACWRRHFATNRVLITAAGQLEHERLLDLVSSAFSELPGPTTTSQTIPDGSRLPYVIEEEDQEQVTFSWGGRSYPARDERNFALAMVDSVLGGSTTSRLFQEVREKRGLAYDVATFSLGFRDTGLFSTTGACSPQTFPEVLALVRQQVDALRTQGISEKELTRAKEQLKAGLALSLESSAERMNILATHQLTWGRIYPLAYLMERINQVTREDIIRVIDEVLNTANWSFAAIGPVEQSAIAAILEG